jgi:hypothetical protein
MKNSLIYSTNVPSLMKILGKNIFPFIIQIRMFSPCRCSLLPAPIQAHIDHLYEQIDDLTIQLSEERVKSKQARIKVFYCSGFFLTRENIFS